MKIAIMQPYFFPYLGYFQLINAVDEFVVYDTIKYTKKGWINRNRILVDGNYAYITLPLKNDSDSLPIVGRYLSESWQKDKAKLLNRLTEAYRKAPFFNIIYPLIETCIQFEKNNLFDFIFYSLQRISAYLEINTQLTISSSISINNELISSEKVIALCKARNAKIYLNSPGGTTLYSKEEFAKMGIDLYFLFPDKIVYNQYDNFFVPNLSIIDVLMFNSKQKVLEYLESFKLYSELD